jgi:Rad3-related DNA helicase
MRQELEENRVWVVNILEKGYINYKGKGRQFKPIRIDKFLQRLVWSQTNKVILSSATIPFRSNIKRWLMRIGLGNKKYSFHSVPMTFLAKNRPIVTSTIGGKMTNKEEDKHWKSNIDTIKEIIIRHEHQKGVIHTHSYNRARKIAHDLRNFDIFLHDKKEIDGDVIDEWVNSRKNILISPAITEGVDLKDDLCRYQIMLKVPYPSIADSRVKYLLNKKNQWNWYYNETAKDIIQMYGRAVRNLEDYAYFYIIDGSFKDIKRRVKFPEWFLNAIEVKN